MLIEVLLFVFLACTLILLIMQFKVLLVSGVHEVPRGMEKWLLVIMALSLVAMVATYMDGWWP